MVRLVAPLQYTPRRAPPLSSPQNAAEGGLSASVDPRGRGDELAEATAESRDRHAKTQPAPLRGHLTVMPALRMAACGVVASSALLALCGALVSSLYAWSWWSGSVPCLGLTRVRKGMCVYDVCTCAVIDVDLSRRSSTTYCCREPRAEALLPDDPPVPAPGPPAPPNVRERPSAPARSSGEVSCRQLAGEGACEPTCILAKRFL